MSEHLTPAEVEAMIRLAEWEDKRRRRHVRRRRMKKLGLALMVPVIPLQVGDWWAENEHRGWR